jgi:hypothetical protein
MEPTRRDVQELAFAMTKLATSIDRLVLILQANSITALVEKAVEESKS